MNIDIGKYWRYSQTRWKRIKISCTMVHVRFCDDGVNGGVDVSRLPVARSAGPCDNLMNFENRAPSNLKHCAHHDLSQLRQNDAQSLHPLLRKLRATLHCSKADTTPATIAIFDRCAPTAQSVYHTHRGTTKSGPRNRSRRCSHRRFRTKE